MNFSVEAQNLDEYFSIAAENNPALKAKFKSFEAALQRVPQVGSLSDPTLSFGAFISPVETRVGPQRARISLTQIFPWFGTLEAKENAARLLAEAAYQEFLDYRNKLFFEISTAYYPLLEQSILYSIEEQNLQILESYKVLATNKFQNGKGRMVDVLRIDIMLKETATNLLILEKKKTPLENYFNRLLNRDINLAVSIDDSLTLSEIDYELIQKSIIWSSNPKVEELSLKIKASVQKEEVALKQRYPNFGVGLDYVMVDKRTDINVPDNGKDILMPMLSVSLPIFKAKYRAAKNEAKLMQESYTYQKEDVINRLKSAYDMNHFELERQIELIKLYEQQLQELAQSQRLLLAAYSNSETAFDEVLATQQQILAFEKMKIRAQVEYLIAQSELDYITAKSR
jgi:outer membrane protein TolC